MNCDTHTIQDVATEESSQTSSSPVELALIFLRLGTLAFGGPAANVAIMRSEFVDIRHWLTEGEFLDLLGAASLIPGPSSTEVAILIGSRRGGWIGLLMAGMFFILPAALIACAIAWAYVRFGHLPQASGLLYGIKPVIIAVVIMALWKLGRSAITTWWAANVGLCALALCICGAPPLLVLFGSGALSGLRGWRHDRPIRGTAPFMAMLGGIVLLVMLPTVLTAFEPSPASAVGLSALFLVFLKLGSVLYGSGYVLIAFLRIDLVRRLHWLTSAQILDAVAVGQITPGPIFTTATFIGYLLAGTPGAAIATIGMFLPAFIFVASIGPVVPLIRQSPPMARFLDGVNIAALALMAFATWQLGKAALVDGLSVAVALTVTSIELVFHWRISAVWLLLAGAAVGLFATSIHL